MKKVFVLLVVLLMVATVGLLDKRWKKSKPILVKADKVVVWKSKREMQLLRQGQIIRRYTISLGDQPTGHKRKEGDERTPEGKYQLDWRNDKSTCYKSLHISYPNLADREHAKKLGVSPGGSIMIHGLANGMGWLGAFHTWRDWTNGCVAVTNEEMDEIWEAVPDGTTIEINP